MPLRLGVCGERVALSRCRYGPCAGAVARLSLGRRYAIVAMVVLVAVVVPTIMAVLVAVRMAVLVPMIMRVVMIMIVMMQALARARAARIF